MITGHTVTTIILQIHKTMLNKTISNCQRVLNVHLTQKNQSHVNEWKSQGKMFLPYATNWLLMRTFRCGHGRANLFPKA